MHGKYPLPLEGALPEYPSRSQKEIVRVPRHLEGWRVGNQKRARPCWLGARSSTENCLIEQLVRALPPPPGGLLAEGPVAYALRAPPQTSVSATLLRQTEWRCPGLGPANFCTITAPSKLRRRGADLAFFDAENTSSPVFRCLHSPTPKVNPLKFIKGQYFMKTAPRPRGARASLWRGLKSSGHFRAGRERRA